MDPQKVLTSHIDDIVFEGRNKAYGAYFLRRIYEKHIRNALIAGLVAAALATAAPYIAQAVMGFVGKEKEEQTVVEVNLENLELPPPEAAPPPPPPPPPPPEPPPMKSTIKYVPPEPKKDEEVIKEEPPPPVEDIKKVDISTQTKEGSDKGVSQDLAPQKVEEPPPPPVVEEKKPVEPEIFTVVEQQPEFEGGQSALFKYLSENIKYPAIARENNIQGRVVVKFVVNEDGTVGAAQVLRGIGGGCDEEAVRVVKSMSGKWNPGKQRGKPVKVYFTLPVQFKLE